MDITIVNGFLNQLITGGHHLVGFPRLCEYAGGFKWESSSNIWEMAWNYWDHDQRVSEHGGYLQIGCFSITLNVVAGARTLQISWTQ